MAVTSARTRAVVAWGWVFWAAIALGLGLRALIAFSPGYYLDSDVSIVYLESLRAGQGELDPFFWGQGYGGTAIQWVSGLLYTFLPADPLVMTAVEVAFSLVAVLLLRGIVTRAFGLGAGTVAALLMWLAGYQLMRQTLIDPGFYATSLAFGLLAVRLALDERRRVWLQLALVGLAGGLAFWQSLMGAAIALPAIIVLLMRRVRGWRWCWLGAGFLVGIAPWIVGTLQYHDSVLPRGNPFRDLVGNLIRLVGDMLPAVFTDGGGRPIDWIVGVLLTAAVIVALGFAIRDRNAAAIALTAGAGLVAIVLVASGDSIGQDSRRYAAFFVPAIATALVWFATRWRRAAVPVLATGSAVVLGLNVASVAVATDGFVLRHDAASVYGEQSIEIAAELDRRGVGAAFGSYWVAYPVSAYTGGRLAVSGLASGEYARYWPYAEQALAEPGTVYVVLVGGPDDQILQQQAAAGEATRSVIDAVAVYQFRSSVAPWTLGLGDT